MILSNDENLSPFMMQYVWEQSDAQLGVQNAVGPCNRCGRTRQWGWCPNCHPLHFKELP